MNLISFYTSANQFQQYYRLKSANFLYQSNVNLLMERISLATVKDKDAVYIFVIRWSFILGILWRDWLDENNFKSR